ncbi:helix-turn-helix transcriptional regulator [Vulgatibacter incomptus]|uniref:Transcriptional regulator, DeoR family n=1 Tax=Vulgatibacter incomptus TaxID=1391653 RepID=A0A0K1PHH7_9BACT|nr:WYL domain-containing protein [Vulgatibacter incomptus]AKU92569.1 Transcriptional regulator, DeoR family [Vulgatibacter incomptus]
MRADRLVRLLLLLQSRSGWTAATLADQLEVSERTVYRDLDALSASGIPVQAVRGPGGGVSLMDGFRTELTGLTRAEVHAIASVGESPALGDLQLRLPLRSALAKLGFGLPPAQQQVIAYARQRLHVDPTPFFGEPEEVPHLEALREAVWQNRRIRLAYVDFDGTRSRRLIDPQGLVVKADRWYLVAITSRGPAVFRGSRIERSTLLDQTFERPADFDLPTFWRQWSARFAEKRAVYEVRLRLTEEGAAALRALRPRAEHGHIAAGETVVDFERESIAVSQLCHAPTGVEVLAPDDLRSRLRAIGTAFNATYG